MISPVPPVFIYVAGALLLPLIRGQRLRQAFLLLIPSVAWMDLMRIPKGADWVYPFLDFHIVLTRADSLSMVFAYVFVIISFIGMVYAIDIRETGQHSAALLYAGSGLGVVFAGDLLTLLIFWEMMAASSVFLIWYRRTKASIDAGFRYILVHLAGGAVLTAGVVIHAAGAGSLEMVRLDFTTLSAKLIFIGFIINAAVPPFHAWLPDAYPEGTLTGSVFLTAFTTKSAVYVLARCFPGLEPLVWLGAVMALYGVVYAVMEKDLRRLLSYHIVSQVGYMVCGVGLGSEMAINGAAAHAFCHIIYKALLFMGAGAVIQVTGFRKMTDCYGRGLYKKIPITLSLYMVGAFSISGVPLFNGFISKSMVVAAAGELHRPLIESMLHLASVGTWLSVGLKLPWGTWFGNTRTGAGNLAEPGVESGIEPPAIVKEPPINMLAAMGIASLLCLATGIFPDLIYRVLPYPVSFHPYASGHVAAAIQMLVLTAAGFWLLLDRVMSGKPTLNLDTDWFYRMFGRALMRFCRVYLESIRSSIRRFSENRTSAVIRFGNNPYAAAKQIVYRLAGDTDPRPISEEELPYRFPIGLGVLASLVFLSVFGIFILSVSR